MGLLVVGIVFLGWGIVLILLRRQVAALVANGHRDYLGAAGRRMASSSTPRLSARVGAGFIAMGVLAVFCALFLRVLS